MPYLTEKEKKMMEEITERCTKRRFAELQKIKIEPGSLIKVSDNPLHGTKCSRLEFLDLLSKDPVIKERYKSGHYIYYKEMICVRGAVILESDLEFDDVSGIYRWKDEPKKKGNLGYAYYKMPEEMIRELNLTKKTYKDHKQFEDFYDAIRYFIKLRNTNQTAIALELNVSPGYISNVMNRREALSVRLIVAMMIILHVSPYYSKKILSLAGFSVEESPKYLVYHILLNEHYTASLEYCDAVIDVLCTEEERKELKLIRKI